MNISTRFPPEAESRLQELVKHFNSTPTPAPVTASSVIRHAVDRLYEQELGKGKAKR